MMRDHKPISIADQVFEKLERDILSGKYPQGEILSELRLSGELGVSRTPIREAIRRLEQERILEDSGHGLVVIGISRQDMLDIYEIRLQLEGLAAKRAAASITDDVLSEMKEVLDLQRFYIESEKEPGENSDQVKNLDSRFHELLYNSCGSRPYADTLISLHKKIIKYRKASVTHHSRAVHALEEHTAIYEALAAHDDLHGQADEVGVLELHAGAFFAVVEQHVEAHLAEQLVQFVGLGGGVGVLGIKVDQFEVERREGRREGDAVAVVVLLDAGRDHAGDADAVTAHDGGLFLAVLVEINGVEGLGILGAELEDVAHFDALGEGHRLAAAGADVYFFEARFSVEINRSMEILSCR